MIRGGCLCGAVRFRVDEPLREIIACHCEQCRRTSGHYIAATAAPRSAITLESENGLCWYRASPTAKRGFCRMCGSNLFWSPEGKDWMSIFAGALDAPTGLTIAKHIFVDDKSDYYEITDGLPQHGGDG